MTGAVRGMRAQGPAVALALMLCTQGCSSSGDSIMDELELPVFGGDGGEEQSLEVPPDLDEPETRETYDMSSTREGIDGAGVSRVLPRRLGMSLHSEGNITWLAVGATPDGLWPHLLGFWRSYGFEITGESMLHGYIETTWREQRLNVGESVRVRDMFRMRIERAPYGATNVYLANRKATLVNGDWQLVFGDRETEVDILYDLSDYLEARREVKSIDLAPLQNVRIALEIRDLSGVPVLSIGQAYSQVWRRLGVTLDRAGLDVRREDPSRGIYLIRYRRGEPAAAAASQLLQLHLLEQGKNTLVTVHPNRKHSAALPYEDAHEVLSHIVRTYEVRL